ncbi:MAG: hypothetical protein ACD_71C00114G0014 [uncultured bacterium (gcode 4)]|uniref:Uncharacterized protein n=1 Tax=uncultured bacterium (gcode 4) TaxID=1234023 RepID=K1Z5I4_9BACT|nr:MAG: hypothetical protein ACD_71C00114G0014 [uncultured bacterium (gcode 4)]
MIIQKRDLEVFRIVSELGFATSNTIRRIVSPETKQKTFNLRLSTLKKEWFLREISWDNRIRNQHSVYSMNVSKNNLLRIKTEIWIRFDPVLYNPGYQLYLHRIYLWNLFASFLSKFREKVPDFSLSDCRILWTKTVQKEMKYLQLHPELGIDYVDDIMIPDLTFIYKKNAFLFELENINSYGQFQQKITGYEEMLLKKDISNFYTTFQGKNIQLLVATRGVKMQRYKEILSWYSWKRNLIQIENILKLK